ELLPAGFMPAFRVFGILLRAREKSDCESPPTMDSRTPAAEKESSIRIPGTSITIGRVEFIAIIACMMAMNALAIDIVLPALPDIGDALGAGSENARQHVLTAYILGFGGAQLLFGPLSDRFGRKPPLIAGMALYVIAGLAGGLATEFWFLL